MSQSRAIILLSGGLDSATVLAMAKHGVSIATPSGLTMVRSIGQSLKQLRGLLMRLVTIRIR